MKTIQAKEVKAILRKQFPSLNKPWFGLDPITLRDREYPIIPHGLYAEIDFVVWNHVMAMGFEYNEGFLDCDDAADIKLGRFKEIWWQYIKDKRIPEGLPPLYGVCEGYLDGVMHDFNLIISDKIYVSDYGHIVAPDNYTPVLARF